MRLVNRIKRLANFGIGRFRSPDGNLMLLGTLLAKDARRTGAIESFGEVEFSVFSQFGDDGVIQWLVGNLPLAHASFVEFGVEDYREATTRFLLMKDNWSGVVIDGSPKAVAAIRNAEYFWRHDLTAVAAFIDCDNINDLLTAAGISGPIGILHVDIDGNDYWVLDAISVVAPDILILEYNAVFGAERAITVPYDPGFMRTAAHSSNLYYGASLPALNHLAAARGYAFIGCTTAGNNAYFVRRELLNDVVRERTLADGFVMSKMRESRDSKSRLTFLAGSARLQLINGMPVVNVITGETETL